MRLLIALSVVVLACRPAAGQEELVLSIRWSEVQQKGQLLAGEIQPGGGAGPDEYLAIRNATELPLNAALISLEHPKITTTQYALTGTVSYEGVRGTGYLEMWNHFPGGGAYFSRTLGDSGPMGSLRGTSNWRPFMLPFVSDAKTGPPSRLELNLALPGPGTVKLGELRLVQYPNGLAALSPAKAWWTDRTAGWIGAIGGSMCGCLGAMIGLLSGLGKARRSVISLSVGLVAFGVACLVAGLVAWLVSQPYAVYFPLILGGVICTAVVGGSLPGICRHYQAMELRKMASMDVDTVSV